MVYFTLLFHKCAARGSVVVKALCYKLQGTGVYSASNRNEYQKHNNNKKSFLGVKCGGCIGLTNLPPSVSRLSNNVGSLTSHNPIGLQGLLRGYLYFLLSHPLPGRTKEHYEYSKSGYPASRPELSLGTLKWKEVLVHCSFPSINSLAHVYIIPLPAHCSCEQKNIYLYSAYENEPEHLNVMLYTCIL
jgi:hypothetical protein